MKKTILCFILFLPFFILKAQETTSTSDQNPNYLLSLAKYQSSQDRYASEMNTTQQNTYKAYDWTEAKEEKKNQRIDFRQKRALARINSNRCVNYRPFWNRRVPYYWY